jgi:hypothetical protein
MLNKVSRATANGAGEVFALSQTHSGNGQANAPNGKAPSAKRGSSTNAIGEGASYSQPGNGQAQSTNGSNGSEIRAGVFLSKQTLDTVLRHKSGRAADMIALLAFYHYTALWQRTNQPRANVNYLAKGLRWGCHKVRAIRALLLELNLIEDVRVTDPRTHKVKGWFTRVAFFHPTDFPAKATLTVFHRVASSTTNALRSNRVNALRSGKQCKTSLHAAHSKAARRVRRPLPASQKALAGYKPHERQVIDAYHSIVCDNDRSWRYVNKYTASVCDVIEIFFSDGFEDVETFFRQALAASRCGCGHEDCEHCGAVSIPPPGRSRTLVNMSWKKLLSTNTHKL